MLSKLSTYPLAKLGSLYGAFLLVLLSVYLLNEFYPSVSISSAKGLIFNDTTSQTNKAVNTVASTKLLARINTELSNTNFVLQALDNSVLEALDQKMALRYREYQKVCLYTSLADQLILNGVQDRLKDTLTVVYASKEFHKTPMQIKTHLRLISSNTGGKYSFLSTEQKSELKIYQDIVEAYVIHKQANVNTFLARFRRSKTEAEYQEIIAFLTRRKLKI